MSDTKYEELGEFGISGEPKDLRIRIHRVRDDLNGYDYIVVRAEGNWTFNLKTDSGSKTGKK